MRRKPPEPKPPSWWATRIAQVRAEEAVSDLARSLLDPAADVERALSLAIWRSWTAAGFVLIVRRDSSKFPEPEEVEARVVALVALPRPLEASSYAHSEEELRVQSQDLTDAVIATGGFDAGSIQDHHAELVKTLAERWARGIGEAEQDPRVKGGIAGWRRVLIVGSGPGTAAELAAGGEVGTEGHREVTVDEVNSRSRKRKPTGSSEPSAYPPGSLVTLTTEEIVRALRKQVGDTGGRPAYKSMLLVEVAAQAGPRPLMDLPRPTAAYFAGTAELLAWSVTERETWSKDLAAATTSACRGSFFVGAQLVGWERSLAEWTERALAQSDAFRNEGLRGPTPRIRESPYTDQGHHVGWFRQFCSRYGTDLYYTYARAVNDARIAAGIGPHDGH